MYLPCPCDICYYNFLNWAISTGFELQSTDVQEGSTKGETPENHIDQHVNVGFSDSNPGVAINFSPTKEVSYYDGYASGVELAKFLSRPVLISTITLSTGSSLVPQHLAPWQSFFNDTIIKKKLDNFSMLSCDLKIKVIINASPFYYGCYMVAYQPLINEGYQSAATGYSYSNLSTTAASSTRASIASLSQLQRFFVYPQSNQGGEMTLPFIYHKNWLRATLNVDFAQMGTLYIYPLVDLTNANGATGTVNMQIYAWAENVKLSGPTYGLALQSSDEYGTGPVSSMASAIAEATGMLTDVPIIGKYMTATSAVSSAIGSVARLFGFTNPPYIDNVEAFKNLPFHGFASSDISSPVEKLSLDPKNELSIDPSIVGLDNSDCMILSELVQREGYLNAYSWALSDTPGALLFASQVLPELIVKTVNTTITPNYNVRTGTPMAHFAKMFSFWKGDIIFRFKFICSKFHRGRVRITFDPDNDIITNSSTNTTSFTKIVDISAESDVEVRVPFMQTWPWLKSIYANDSVTEYYGGNSSTYAGLGGRQAGSSNGILTVRVFTEATAPATTAPISMLVFVRGADNLEFGAPAEVPYNLSYFALQSLDEVTYDVPSELSMTNDKQSKSDPHKFLVNHGETIKSLRQILRRTTLSRTSNTSSGLTDPFIFQTQFFDRRPIYYGYDPNGINTGLSTVAGTKNFNYSFNTPYNWTAPCFLSERGAHRWSINIDCPQNVSNVRTSRVFQTRTRVWTASSVSGATPTSSGIAKLPLDRMWNGLSGSTLNNQFTQTGISIEAPLYSQYRMISTSPNNIVTGNAIDGTDIDTLRLDFDTVVSSALNDPGARTIVWYYHSIGTDFTFLKFMRVHPMAVCPVPTSV